MKNNIEKSISTVKNNVTNRAGITIGETINLYTLLFVTLKLCKVINWSWFLVLSPLIIPLLLFLLVSILELIVTRNETN